MAHVSKVAHEKIFIARGIHSVPFFLYQSCYIINNVQVDQNKTEPMFRLEFFFKSRVRKRDVFS